MAPSKQDDFSGVYAQGVDEIAIDLRNEFFEDLSQSLSDLTLLIVSVRSNEAKNDDIIDAVRRFCLPLRGQAANFGARIIGTIAARMEDYLANVKNLPATFLDDLQAFIDTLEDIVEGNIPLSTDASELVRKLPAKVKFQADDITIEVRNIEVLLVMLHGTATRFVEREMQECGYRVATITNTFEAIPTIIHTKPNMVIISAMMPELEGIDLAVALSAMPATRNIPTALITSLDADDDHLKLIPQSVPIINKGPSFGDDLADAMESLFII